MDTSSCPRERPPAHRKAFFRIVWAPRRGKIELLGRPCPLPPMAPPHQPSPGETTWGLILIGDNATDKVGLCGPQVGHQLVEILLAVGEGRRHKGKKQNWKP